VSFKLTFLDWLLRWTTLFHSAELFNLTVFYNDIFLRAIMQTVNAEVVLKATNVDGVYDADPRYNPNTRLLETVSYHEVITRDLSVMDMTAITLCQENNIPGKDAINFDTFLNNTIVKSQPPLCVAFCSRLKNVNVALHFAVVVFNLQKPGNIAKAIVGENVGTFIGCTRDQEKNGNALGEERRLVNEV
jgi:uridylate kinase